MAKGKRIVIFLLLTLVLGAGLQTFLSDVVKLKPGLLIRNLNSSPMS